LIEAFELFDDEIKGKLGTENLKLSPRSYSYFDGILCIGFE
jgi:Ca2+-binding EF-hand superfamily protein